MARQLKSAQLIRGTVVLALAAWVFAAPIHAQSNAAPAPGEPGSKASEGAPKQAASAVPKAEPAGAGSPSASATPGEGTRETQIEAQTKDLFRLSAELRAEVAKTYKDTLSLAVLKKAEQVEKLAKSLKTLMNAEAADNEHKNR